MYWIVGEVVRVVVFCGVVVGVFGVVKEGVEEWKIG